MSQFPTPICSQEFHNHCCLSLQKQGITSLEPCHNEQPKISHLRLNTSTPIKITFGVVVNSLFGINKHPITLFISSKGIKNTNWTKHVYESYHFSEANLYELLKSGHQHRRLGQSNSSSGNKLDQIGDIHFMVFVYCNAFLCFVMFNFVGFSCKLLIGTIP